MVGILRNRSVIIERGVPGGAVLYLGRCVVVGFGGIGPGGVLGPHDKRFVDVRGCDSGGGLGKSTFVAGDFVAGGSSAVVREVGESGEGLTDTSTT